MLLPKQVIYKLKEHMLYKLYSTFFLFFFLLVPRTNFVLPFFICINSSPRKTIKFLYVLLLSSNPEQLFHFLKLPVDKSPFKLLSEEHAVSES